MKKGRISSPHSQAGFTLLEMLVVITLIGLMMPLFYATIQTGIKAWVHGQQHVSHAVHVQNIQKLLRQQLSQIYPKYLSQVGTKGHVDFDGRPESIQFLAPMPEALGYGGMGVTKLYLVQKKDGFHLVMTQRPELSWDDGSEPQPVTLIKGLKSASFSYYGGDPMPSWRDSWSSENELPRLIRLRVEYTDGKRLWPELIVGPRVSADVGCLYDPLTKYCQGR